MLRPIRAPGNIAMLAAAMLFVLPGCATMVARSGISGSHEIPTELSRKEVQERFGSPASSGTTSFGRPIEVYHVRRQIDLARLRGDNRSDADKEGGKFACILMLPACLMAAPFAIAASETVYFPVAVVASAMNKLEVAFVYGPDDRVLYFYEPKAGPYSRPSQALRTLPHPLSSETELAKCPSARECVARYVEEARGRMREVDYTPTAEDEKAFQLDLALAHDVDEKKLTREEAVRRR